MWANKTQQTERWCENETKRNARPNFVPTPSKHFPEIVQKIDAPYTCSLEHIDSVLNILEL